MAVWTYEVEVVGQLSEAVLARIDAEVGKVLVTTEPVTTVIRGSVADQSGLVGLLDLMHAHGLQVCEIRRVAEAEGETNAGGSFEPGSGTRSE
jgi:hypothetical protein